MLLLADLDRASAGDAWRRIQMDRWATRDGFEVHEYGLLEVVQEFAAAGLVVAAGWRDWENLGDSGIAPDAMVCLRYGPYGPGWHYLEYERSATSPSSVAKKLHGFDSPLLRSNDWPVLVVCRNAKAEENFQRRGLEKNLAMLTTTIPRFRKHGAVGNLRCWSRYGEPAAIG